MRYLLLLALLLSVVACSKSNETPQPCWQCIVEKQIYNDTVTVYGAEPVLYNFNGSRANCVRK